MTDDAIIIGPTDDRDYDAIRDEWMLRYKGHRVKFTGEVVRKFRGDIFRATAINIEREESRRRQQEEHGCE